MARVRVCKFCGHPNPADELFCQECGRPVHNLPMIHRSKIEEKHVEDLSPETPFNGTTRDRQDAKEQSFATLECPWGPLKVMGTASIGRDASFCAEAERFSGYTTVSRVHATVFYSQDNWYVRDLGSMNGTFLNGVRLGADEDHLLADGDQLYFSKSLRTVFRT